MQNQIKTLSVNELTNILAKVNSPQPIGFVALTEPTMRKTGNPYAGKIRKLSKINAFVRDYSNSVNAQLAREGKDQLHFTAKPRKWGRHVSLALVEHNGKHYLSSCPLHSKPFWLVLTELGLTPIAKAAIEAFLPEHKAPTNQGTDKAIEPRDYSLDSIASIAIGGQRYRIRHSA